MEEGKLDSMMKGIKESTKVTEKDKKETTKITKVLKDLGKSTGNRPPIVMLGYINTTNISCSSMLAK